MVRRIIRAALGILVVVLVGAWITGWLLSRPHLSMVPAPAPPGRAVHLTASDGVAIAASYWPGARPDGPAILLLHGINTTRDRLRAQALWLNRLGYAVLAIDFRGHGESGAAARTFGLYEARDAAAALAFLRRGAPARRVGLIGISLGGAAACSATRARCRCRRWSFTRSTPICAPRSSTASPASPAGRSPISANRCSASSLGRATACPRPALPRSRASAASMDPS
jgi:pimeloyl-ACP methyl ester carboxylesterase